MANDPRNLKERTPAPVMNTDYFCPYCVLPSKGCNRGERYIYKLGMPDLINEKDGALHKFASPVASIQ